MSNPLIEQFIIESRDNLQRISEIIIALEEKVENKELLNELFRLVHTLKGNSGLFEFPSMTRLLHAGEDLMNLVREGTIPYDSNIADILLEAMDTVSIMIDEIEFSGSLSSDTIQSAENKTHHIRELISKQKRGSESEGEGKSEKTVNAPDSSPHLHLHSNSPSHSLPLNLIPEELRIEAVKKFFEGKKIKFIQYYPESECFYKGEDPFYFVRTTPELIWTRFYLREEISDTSLMDVYKCIINFDLLSFASKDELTEHFKYVLDQIKFIEVEPTSLIIPEGKKNGGPVYEDFVSDAKIFIQENNITVFKNAVKSLIELSSPELYFSSILRWIDALIEYLPKTKVIIEVLLQSLESDSPPVFSYSKEYKSESTLEKTPEFPEEFFKILNTQKIVLQKIKTIEDYLTKDNVLKSVILSLENALISLKDEEALKTFKEISQKSSIDDFTHLLNWIEKIGSGFKSDEDKKSESLEVPIKVQPEVSPIATEHQATEKEVSLAHTVGKVLKVDEVKIERLMNLIGEFVVAKNSLPYLTQKADNIYRVTELAKEIKVQYSILNRISEEMQDAIMQIRMIPVSTVFQRFPRLVRDLSKKLNKKVNLITEGEETEADKNVIESLSDPLIHIIRNSLDHGIEAPEERISKGKPEAGTIILRAKHEADHVLIEVIDDGKGVDPEKVKLKAYQKGLITEERFETMNIDEAVNLIFMPGFSTAEVATDLSGRGVGMDVVRTTVEKFGGSVRVQSTVDKGTTITLSLPLSMAVSHVMIIESAGEKYGIPMESVVETVRISKDKIHTIKGKMTTVLRNKVVPLFNLNDLMEINKSHITSEAGEYAVLVLSVKGDLTGIIIDKFHETADIILKPFTGFLSNLKIFSGTAIMGDGSVLLTINPKELVNASRV